MNQGDSPEVINKYVNENKFSFKIGMSGKKTSDGKAYDVPALYGVQAYPTNYLVDPDGKILWRSVGFDENGLRDALAKAGLK